MTDLLITNIGELCRMSDRPGPQAGPAQGDTGSVRDAALAIADGAVVAAGPRAEVERAHGNKAGQTLDARGRAVRINTGNVGSSGEDCPYPITTWTVPSSSNRRQS